MINRFEASQFGCVKEVSLALSQVHAFIGPNDSGKCTLLRAIATAAQLALGRSELDPRFRNETCLRAVAGSGTYAVKQDRGNLEESWDSGGVVKPGHNRPPGRDVLREPTASERYIVAAVGGAAMVRFDAAVLRRSSSLIPESEQIRFFDERGYGLPGIYQAILGRGDDAFRKISDSVRRLFPTVKAMRVSPLSTSELVLEVELVDGTRVRPELMSDGLLYYLGFAAIPYLTRVAVLLVEEPENGLHPARIRDVVRLLREFARDTGTQIIMATHSPLVVNELGGDEVTVVTRDAERGTQAKLIKDTPDFERRAKVAELGELWLSYANGVDEAPLLRPNPFGP